MADLVNLTIDGAAVAAPKGMLIVDAAKRAGNDIPVFCYHPKLEPVGMCRMCLVEIGTPKMDPATKQPVMDEQGQPVIAWMPKLQTACTTPISEGMVVRGATEPVTEARREVLEFLLTSHPLDCPICDKGGECPLQNLTMRHGPGNSRFLYDEKIHLAKHLPLGDPDEALIFLDRERCIQCARCTRFSDEIADDHVIGFYERGRKLEIVTFSDPGFDSKFSGNTTDICPVGALTTRDFRFRARPWELESAASICPHCPVGCNLTLNTRRDTRTGGWEVKRVMPRQNEQVNEIWICDKGRFGYHFSTSAERLTTPLVRKDGKLEPATWNEALELAAEKMKAAGPGLVGLAGERLANEDLHNFRSLVTGLGGRAEGYGAMAGGDQVQQVGVGVGTNFSSMGKGSAILVVASDLEEEAPIWWLRVKQAAERGATLIVANGRATKTDRAATHHVRYAYGDETATILAMMAHVAPDDQMKAIAARYAAGDETLAGAAKAFAEAKDAVVLFGREGLDFQASAALAQACANLVIATGHFGKPNNGLIGVWPHGNSQGMWDMGLRPTGRSTPEVLNGAKVVLVAGCNPVADGGPEAAQALKAADFVIVQELFLTETAQAADIVLPAQSFVEREGTYTNGERRVQRFYPAMPARGDTQPDWQISAEIGKRAGLTLPTGSAALVLLDIARSVPAYAGLTYGDLARVERQWPDVGGADLYYGGTAYDNSRGLGVQVKSGAERGEQPEQKWVESPAASASAGEGELKVVARTVLYDRSTTFKPSALMHPRVLPAHVELNPADAARLGIGDGDSVTVRVNGSSAKVMARVPAQANAPAGVALLARNLGIMLEDGTFAARIEKA